MIFRDNLKPEIYGKNVLLLASATTGKHHAFVECIEYYGGILQGYLSSLAQLIQLTDIELMHYLEADDIPNYEAFTHSDCPMCKEGKPVEALVNGYGYSEI